MKLSLLPYVSGTAAVLALAAYASHLQQAQANDSVATAETTRIGPDQLRYPVGSPQLSYLRIEQVKATSPALMEPLPARITFDEDHTVRVFSPVAGRVAQIVVQAGQAVRAGDALAWLLSADYDTAIADQNKAQADFDNKHAAFVRAQSLNTAGVIATREMEAAQAEARSAQAELARATARLHGLGKVDRDGRFALRAPIAGVVAERHLNPGQELRPDAADPAFVITDPAHLDVLADVAESDVGQLHVGQPVRIQAEGSTWPEMNGQISAIGVSMDAATRRVPVRAHLQSPPAAARPDMFVRMAPLGDASALAVAVPNSAIITTGQQSHVFVERSPGLMVKTPVIFVHRGRELSYVSSGLAPNARVVTKGAILLDAELSSGN